MKELRTVGVGLLGVGTIGSGAYDQFYTKRTEHRAAGFDFRVEKVLVRDLEKQRRVHIQKDVLTTSLDAVIDDPSVEVVISVLGNKDAEREAILKALKAGKKVVTANKEVIAQNGRELLGIASDLNTGLYFEAAVAGGIRIVDNLVNSYAFDQFDSLRGILNGTTNYILTRMSREGMDFESALQDAQKLGYAEPDPTNDIEGKDAAFKISILASLAFREGWIDPNEVSVGGITTLQTSDFEYASYMGYTIKLIANAEMSEAGLDVWVSPTLIPKNHKLHVDHPLADVNDALNGLLMSSDPTGRTEIKGLGAGAKPTTAAIMADVLTAATHGQPLKIALNKANIMETRNSLGRNYIRLTVSDEPGTLGKLGNIFGDYKVNIAEVSQRDEAIADGSADFVVTTGPTRQGQLQSALDEISRLRVCQKVSTVMRVLH